MLKLLSDISADPSASSSSQNQGNVADGLSLKSGCGPSPPCLGQHRRNQQASCVQAGVPDPPSRRPKELDLRGGIEPSFSAIHNPLHGDGQNKLSLCRWRPPTASSKGRGNGLAAWLSDRACYKASPSHCHSGHSNKSSQRSGGCVGQTDGRSLARVEFEVVGRIHVDIQHGVPPSAPVEIGGFSLRNPEDDVSISRRIGPPSPATIPALSLRKAKIRDRQADSQSQDLHSRYLVAECSSKQAPACGQHRFRTYCFRAGLTGAWASYRVSRPDRHIDLADDNSRTVWAGIDASQLGDVPVSVATTC